MPGQLDTVDVRDAKTWRTWLQKHHGSSPGVWLLFHKEHTGVPSVADEDAVRLALCFGWIDSLIKRIDDERFARKFTPRTATSKWSDLNRQRWAELNAQGLLAPAGSAAAPTDNRYAPRPAIPTLPGYIATALKTNAKAWTFFQQLPPRERRNFVVWIHMAKLADTRERRIRESIALLAAGKKLGLK